jgi:glycosyltransferase involved in cell wall biosynthesis
MPSESRPVLALEISPLGERHHTGIANVAKGLAAELLEDESVTAHFFFNRATISRAVVERMLKVEGGEILWWIASRADFPTGLRYSAGTPTIGIYPGHKWHRRYFPFEVQIVHDLTTIITPEFHDSDSVEFWQSQLLGDMYSSDLIVAVSESTRTDIHTYFPQLRDIPCIVSKLGLAPNPRGTESHVTNPEPYVLVLGTFEPRKNVEIILRVLSENRDILERARFIFIGRSGWGPKASELIERYGLSAAASAGRLVIAGFVPSTVRDELTRYARCVIYPSHYEGFGLPIIEALRFGTPLITGYGSSLPEAGGDAAIYCDVSSPESVGNALRSVLGSTDSHASAEAGRRRAWAASFERRASYRRIRDAAITLAEAQLAKVDAR